MDDFWWTLPGPAGFVDAITQVIRDGRNVALLLPAHVPADLEHAVRVGLRDWIWDRHEVDAADSREPAHQLYRRFVGTPGGASIRNASTLARESAFHGQVIWVSGLTAAVWPAWSAFIADYANACRAREPGDRALFIIELQGELDDAPPTSDVCLAIHQWGGTVSRMDMLLLGMQLLRRRRLQPFQRQIAAAVIARVAAWDPAVAERLAAENLPSMMRPEPILRELAAERGWDARIGLTLQTSASLAAWRAGLADTVDGEMTVHPAALTAIDLADRVREIDRRIWCAQIGVVMPFVEEQRRRIIEQHAATLRIPHFSGRANDPPIMEREDLELRHIVHQIAVQHVSLGDETNRRVRRLKQARDRLAHLQPLDAAWFSNDEFRVFSADQ